MNRGKEQGIRPTGKRTRYPTKGIIKVQVQYLGICRYTTSACGRWPWVEGLDARAVPTAPAVVPAVHDRGPGSVASDPVDSIPPVSMIVHFHVDDGHRRGFLPENSADKPTDGRQERERNSGLPLSARCRAVEGDAVPVKDVAVVGSQQSASEPPSKPHSLG